MNKKQSVAENVFLYAIKELKRAMPIIYTRQFIEAIELIADGRVWSTGVGKAGLVAQKFSATLACNNVPAGFIHASEALHGCFGAVQPGDVLVAFSNSGKTNEIIEMFRRTKESKIKTILITGNKYPIIKTVDVIICYGKIKEACPLGLTPTTSTLIMLAIADAISMEIQVEKGITIKDYARNHHGGYIGEITRKKSL